MAPGPSNVHRSPRPSPIWSKILVKQNSDYDESVCTMTKEDLEPLAGKLPTDREDKVAQDSEETMYSMPKDFEPFAGKQPTDSGDKCDDHQFCCKSAPWRLGCVPWLRKYFWEGQILSDGVAEKPEEVPEGAPWYTKFYIRYRRPMGLLIPGMFFHFWWWAIAIRFNLWHLFASKYYMSITMWFGSIIAGMTTVGGGAVAFPVMTLAFSLSPSVARDFSLMIQACGMTAATFTIFFMRIQLEWASLICCSTGAIPGLIFGLEYVDPFFTPAQKKMGFVCTWFSFAFALLLLNRFKKRDTFDTIPDLKVWKGIVLFATGILGGICTALAGSGLDMCAFSVLTLLFRVSEKTATPTSVVLMSGNTIVGFYWRHVMMGGVPQDAWHFVFVCVPIVVIGAPLGSLLGSHFHRHVLAGLVYVLDTVALISAFVVVQQTPLLVGISMGLIIGGFFLFFMMTIIGNKMLEKRVTAATA